MTQAEVESMLKDLEGQLKRQQKTVDDLGKPKTTQFVDIPYYSMLKVDELILPLVSKTRIYLNTTPQVFTDGAVAKVNLNATTYDKLGEADITTNYRFTAKKSGYYQVNGAVYFATTVADKRYAAKIYKNGAVYSQVTVHSSNTGLIGIPISDIIPLNTADYVELWARHDAGENQSVTNGATLTYLSICRIL